MGELLGHLSLGANLNSSGSWSLPHPERDNRVASVSHNQGTLIHTGTVSVQCAKVGPPGSSLSLGIRTLACKDAFQGTQMDPDNIFRRSEVFIAKEDFNSSWL